MMKMGYHWRPSGSVKVASKVSGAVVYLCKGAKSGRAMAVGYRSADGKTMAFNYTFASEARRAEYVAEFLKSCDASVAARKARAAEKSAALQKAHDLKVGTVLSGMWGYDQTNVEWYEVTALVGKRMVEIREIASESLDRASMSGVCVPLAGKYVGEAKRRMVGTYDGNSWYVRLHSSCSLTKARKTQVAGVDAGYAALYWSADH